MKITYRRDMDQNHMIIEDDRIKGDCFQIRMMERNRIPHFLPLQVHMMNGNCQLYYQITGMQPISRIYSRRSIRWKDLEMIFGGLQKGMDACGQYLQNTMDIIMDPELLFLDRNNSELYICCVPGFGESESNVRIPSEDSTGSTSENNEEQNESCTAKLAEFILKHLEHEDPAAVQAGYQFYRETMSGNFSMGKVLQNILEAEKTDIRSDNTIVRKAYDDCFSDIEDIRGVGPDGYRVSEKEAAVRSERRSGKTSGKISERATDGIEEEEHGENIREGAKKRGKEKAGVRSKRRTEKTGGSDAYEQKNISGKKKAVGKKPVIITIFAATVLLAVNVLVYFYIDLDLTQTGGLAFLSIALIGLLYRQMQGRKSRTDNIWAETEDRTEDPFLKDLMSGVYDDPEENEKSGTSQNKEEMNSEKNMAEKGTDHCSWQDSDRSDRQEEDGRTRCIIYEADPIVQGLILISSDPMKYQNIMIHEDHCVVGKSADTSDQIIVSDAVSRFHASVDREGEEYYLSDLNSRNGTWLKNTRIDPFTPMKLSDGDEIRFADAEFTVRLQ